MTFTFTRIDDIRFRAESNIAMSDGSMRGDNDMRLDGNVLRSFEERGFYRVGGLLRFTLGPTSMARLLALSAGESVTFNC